MFNVAACRTCLVTGVKMYLMLNTELQEYFRNIVGIDMRSDDGKPQHICYECRSQLRKCQAFRDKCVRCDEVLTQIQMSPEIKITIDRKLYNLNSNLIENQPVILEFLDNNTLETPIKHEDFDFCGNIYKTEEPLEDKSTIHITALSNTLIKCKSNQAVKYEDVNDYSIRVPVEVKLNSEINNADKYSEDTNCFDDNLLSHSTDSEDNIPLNKLPPSKVTKNKRPVKKKLRSKNGDEIEAKRGFNEDYAEVIYLTKEDQIEAMNQRAKSENYLHSPYKCTLCYKGFVDKTAFSKHKEKHDKISGDYECEICHMRYLLHRQLRTHLTTSHTRQYACKKCTHRSHTANQAREHESWHRGFLYECRLCSEKFVKPTSHLTHMRKRHATEFICELCGDSFVGKHGLVMHKTKAHRYYKFNKTVVKDPESYCTDCDVQFLSVVAWKRHVITSLRHANDNSCKICKHPFSTTTELSIHMKEHSKEVNPKIVETKPQVQNIIKISCDQCNYKFTNRSKLQAHIKRIHLGVKYNKNIVCEVCGKKCVSNATLKYHQRTHTGEKPYSCTVCSKKFSDSNQLRIHNRIHTDERPYSCEVCNRAFRQKPALNRHMRVHTGAKPYICHYCTKTFSQTNSLKLHIRTVHLKLPPNNRRNKIVNLMPVLVVEKPTEQNSVITLQSL